MSTSRTFRLALMAGTVVLAAGCAVVPTPDGGVVVPAPVVVSPPAVVVNPWWGYRSYDYGPVYRAPRGYGYGYGRPTPPPPRYWGPATGPSYPPPMR